MNAMSATFSEVGGHRVAWCIGSSFLGTVKAYVFLTGFKVWGWVDNGSTGSVHDVATEHNSLSGLSHTFWGFYVAVGLLRCIGTFVVSFPRVGKKSDTLDNVTLSGGEIVGLVVVEHTAETASLSEEVFVNADEH
jgi:hypothetical protein